MEDIFGQWTLSQMRLVKEKAEEMGVEIDSARVMEIYIQVDALMKGMIGDETPPVHTSGLITPVYQQENAAIQPRPVVEEAPKVGQNGLPLSPGGQLEVESPRDFPGYSEGDNTESVVVRDTRPEGMREVRVAPLEVETPHPEDALTS